MWCFDPLEPDRRPRKRQWTLLPAPSPHRAPFEGAAILDELPSPLGMLLAQRFRDTVLWAQTPVEDRGHLFAHPSGFRAAAVVPSALACELEVLGGMVRYPAIIRDSAVGSACARIAEIVQGEGWLSTAAHFAEAAAYACPRDAALTYNAGRYTRTAAEYERARMWFDRAAGVARRTDDRVMQANVLLGWGVMLVMLGDLPGAEERYRRAWRLARRHKLRHPAAAARHNLMILRMEERRYAEAQIHAAAATSLYGLDHAILPYIAHDVAHLWSGLGWFELALRTFDAVQPYVAQPYFRIVLDGNVGRAAGGANDGARFQAALAAVNASPVRSVAHEALLNLAEGAFLIGDRDTGIRLATEARETAARRRAVLMERAAARLLRALAAPPPPPESAIRTPTAEALALADRLILALRRRSESPAAPRPPTGETGG